jgi:hypothetical protein
MVSEWFRKRLLQNISIPGGLGLQRDACSSFVTPTPARLVLYVLDCVEGFPNLEHVSA